MNATTSRIAFLRPLFLRSFKPLWLTTAISLCVNGSIILFGWFGSVRARFTETLPVLLQPLGSNLIRFFCSSNHIQLCKSVLGKPVGDTYYYFSRRISSCSLNMHCFCFLATTTHSTVVSCKFTQLSACMHLVDFSTNFAEI